MPDTVRRNPSTSVRAVADAVERYWSKDHQVSQDRGLDQFHLQRVTSLLFTDHPACVCYANNVNHLSGYCCMWKAIFAPRYLGAAAEVVKKRIFHFTCYLRMRLSSKELQCFNTTMRIYSIA